MQRAAQDGGSNSKFNHPLQKMLGASPTPISRHSGEGRNDEVFATATLAWMLGNIFEFRIAGMEAILARTQEIGVVFNLGHALRRQRAHFHRFNIPRLELKAAG